MLSTSPSSSSSVRLASVLLLLGLIAASSAHAGLLVPPRASVVENRGEVTIVYERMADVAGALEIEVQTIAGTATAGEDYTRTVTTLFWADGEGGLRDVAIPILDDRKLERNENFAVFVEVLQGLDQLSNQATHVLIEEDDFRRLAERRIDGFGADPSIATEPGGRRLVLFTTPFGVFASFLSPAGAPIGDPFPVRRGDASGGTVDAPAVSGGRAGRFFVAWRVVADQGSRIEGRVFDRGGSPLGPVLALSDDYQGLVGEPRVAVGNRGQVVLLFADPDGRLVARIRSAAETETGTSDDGVTGSGWRSETSAGDPRVERSVLALDLEDFGPADGYEVAAASNLGFVIVARPSEPSFAASRLPANGLGDVIGSVLAQAFGFDGKSRSGIVAVSSDLSAVEPSVAVAVDGQVVIGWSEPSLEGDLDPRIAFYGRGLAIGDAVEVLELERPGDQLGVTVAMNSAGDTVAVWSDLPAGRRSLTGEADASRLGAPGGTGASIVARAFDVGGAPKGEAVLVAESDATTEPTQPSVSVSDDDVINVAFEKKNKVNGSPAGVFDQQIEMTITEGVCRPDERTLCLNELRFQVTASWSDVDSQAGLASSRPLTDDTGTFWFFDQDNVEIVLKVLDACSFSQRFWVFAGGLTDVEVSLTITDIETGKTRVYGNPSGQPFEPIQDTSAFPTCDQGSFRSEPSTAIAPGSTAAGGPCPPDSLCLNEGRFRVDFEFETPNGTRGDGQPESLTGDTGSFWFFNRDNIEAVVKVLDACSFGDRFWVFAAGLTDVAATLTVTDTVTGATQSYENPQSTPFRPITDTDAFATCPE